MKKQMIVETQAQDNDSKMMAGFVRLAFERAINEALEEYVVFNGINSIDNFRLGDLKKLLSEYICDMNNEMLRTKILLEYERAETYIDLENFDCDKIIRSFYFRQMNFLFLPFYKTNKNIESNADGLAEVFPKLLKDFIYSAYPYFREYIQARDKHKMKYFELTQDLHFKIAAILNNIILGKYKKGKSLHKYFKHDILYLTYAPQSFIKLIVYLNNKIVLKSDDIKSDRFITAVLDLIKFSYYKHQAFSLE